MPRLYTDDNYDAVMRGWECHETDRGVPFYVNISDGKTDWDHPYYSKVFEELDAYQDVHYAAYRTALKLRHLQKKLGLHLLSLDCLQSVLQDHGFGASHAGMVDSQALQLMLLDLFHTPDFRHFDLGRQDVASELLYNYLLNLFDVGRSGVMRMLSVKLALAALCNSTLSEKYQYFFQEIQSSRAFVSRDQLSAFVGDLIQIPDLLRESVAFGKNVAAAVDSCVQVAGTLGDGVPEKGFYSWLMREPQTLIWLPTMHRLIAAETIRHECKCSVCKAMPMVGFRYKCLQCFKFNICQDCFFSGRVAKNHQVRHPIQEYCLPVTAKDETKVFLKVMRNKIRGRNRRTNKVPFLPVDNTADQGLLEWEMRPTPTPPSPPSTGRLEGGMEGEAASNDSGHSSDQGGEGSGQGSPEPPSPSPRSVYDNSNSPARYLEERQPKKSLQQDRHSLIHLVHRLRRENRLLRQQLARTGSSLSDEDKETWKSVATAEVMADGDLQSQRNSPDLSSQASHQVTSSSYAINGTSLSETISPIGETASHQRYTSDFFNSILASTTATATATFDVTAQDAGPKSTDVKVLASTPALPAAPAMLKSGPPKPPRLTGLGPQNTVSISYIQADDSLAEGKTGTAAAQVLHRAQVHSQLSPSKEEEITVEQNSTDMGLASADTFTESLNAQKNPVSCDEMWADDTPCTIRKRASKPIRLADEKEASGEAVTPLSSNTLSRRKSTGSLNASDLSHSTKEGCVATPRLLKSYSSLNKLGFRTPGVDKSLFGISHGDSVLLTPERQEIDKMIQWIDRAFPPDLTYSALSLCQDESTTQTRMLQAAKGIGNAMADLVQATADSCYM